MTGFFKLLLGMIDLARVCEVVSVKPECQNEMLDHDVPYGICKGNINDCTWKILIEILESDTFENLLNNFLAEFVFPHELREQMIDIYGVDENKAYSFSVDTSKMKLCYCHQVIRTTDDEHIVLVRIGMTRLSHTILDPCITMLISTYYQALVHYIIFLQKYAEKSSDYFHNPESCSPWVEELFCIAFNEVLGDSDNSNSCRASNKLLEDNLSPIPAYVLRSINEITGNKAVNNSINLDSSIVCKDENSSDIKNGAKVHLYAWRNRISSIMQNNLSSCHTSNSIYIDSLYGYSYDYELFADNTTLYGATKSVPASMEWLLEDYSHDWLRIPFIKVPRFKVKSAEELYKLVKNICGFGALLRGQSSEYNLNRSLPLMKKLYGDEKAVEPSLASYAVRKNMMFEKYYVEWASIIKAYLYSAVGAFYAEYFLSRLDDFNFYLLCLSIAQHYGLPTYGLDVSTSLSTVLFFAFYQFTEIDAKSRKYTYVRKEKGTSIIYAFSPTEGETFDYDRFDLHVDLFPRPSMQKASFAHCSWGYAKNVIAERLIAAIQFDVELIDFEKINGFLRNDHQPELYEDNFFSSTDCFIDFLHKYIENDSNTYNKDFKNYLKKYIYQI